MKPISGLYYGLAAHTMWGLFPIYFKLIDSVPSGEVLLHRILWSVPFGALIIALLGQWSAVGAALRTPKVLAWLGLSALCISGNWYTYIWAVSNDRIFEASLGYYINPLLYMLVGVVFFAERLRLAQWSAVLLAAVGVIILATRGSGVPWISLALAGLFTIYGVMRKQVDTGPMPGLFIETLLIAPLAMAGLAWLNASQQAVFFSAEPQLMTLLVLAGPLTVLPLLFFTMAAKQLTLIVLGFMQFLGPTLQFFVALFFGEQLTPAHIACFLCIWLAIGLFMLDALVTARRNKTSHHGAKRQ